LVFSLLMIWALDRASRIGGQHGGQSVPIITGSGPLPIREGVMRFADADNEGVDEFVVWSAFWCFILLGWHRLACCRLKRHGNCCDA
jgi:hypothetical protein